MSQIEKIFLELEQYSNLEKKEFFEKYFKFYDFPKIKYKRRDKFKGITVPYLRKVAKKYYKILTLKELDIFLHSEIHEYRLFALLVLVLQFQSVLKENQNVYRKLKKIVTYYLKNIDYINNWDLVDLSAPKILGNFLYLYPEKKILYKLANSKHLWKERISILTTFYFIKKGDFEDILILSEKFLNHSHSLIHKAVGWMLREMGKQNKSILLEFLKKHSNSMPPIMYRYAIEKLNEKDKINLQL